HAECESRWSAKKTDKFRADRSERSAASAAEYCRFWSRADNTWLLWKRHFLTFVFVLQSTSPDWPSITVYERSESNFHAHVWSPARPLGQSRWPHHGAHECGVWRLGKRPASDRIER